MTRILSAIQIPAHLFNIRIPLPCERQAAHSKEPASRAIHRMLGFTDQQEGRSLLLTGNGDRPVVTVFTAEGQHVVDLPRLQLLAALSFLEGDQLKGSLKLVKSARGEAPGSELACAQILAGVLTSAQRKVLNAWDRRNRPFPWSGVGIIPMAPDGSELALACKDEFHPRPWFCGRLSLIGGNIDPNEILSGWGDQAACARVGMLRECYEEIRILDVANEIAAAARYFGPARACCYLYEEDGLPTEGTIRAFLAPAPSAEAWSRWRRIFTKEVDGLGEANPAIVTREELRTYVRRDTDAAAARRAALKSPRAAEMLEGEAALTAYLSWKRVYAQTKLETPDLDDLALTERAEVTWKAIRSEAHAARAFPLRGRGNFVFISGHAAPIAHVLRGAGMGL